MGKRQEQTVRGLRAVFQRVAFVLELNGDLEIGNHAAAGALGFLLSAVPALLLSFGLAGALLAAFPGDGQEFRRWVAQFLGPINLPDAAPKLFGQGFFAVGTLAAVAGLLYASRMFFSSIRKTLKVIWGTPDHAPTMVETLGGYALELVALVVLVTVLAVSETARNLVYANQDELTPQVFAVMAIVVDAVPFVILWAFFYVTLRIFPQKRPSRRRVAAYSLVAVTLFSAVAQILRVAINTDQYELMYGLIANLVVVLLNVSTFFTLYFMSAAFLFVEQNFDALLFGRYFRHWGVAELPFPDSLLFKSAPRLWQLYGRAYAAGEHLFEAGDDGRTAYFLERGEVEIVLGGKVIDRLTPGQVFGETAAILGERRNAGARAGGEVFVLALPYEVFGFYLRSDRFASRKIIGTMADRLKRANLREAGPSLDPESSSL